MAPTGVASEHDDKQVPKSCLRRYMAFSISCSIDIGDEWSLGRYFKVQFVILSIANSVSRHDFVTVNLIALFVVTFVAD